MQIKISISSLLSINRTNDLQPIDDFVGQTGLFELNADGDLQPILGIEVDYSLTLNGYNDITPT